MTAHTRSKNGGSFASGIDLPVSTLRTAVATPAGQLPPRQQLSGDAQRPQTSPQPHHGIHSTLSPYASLLATSLSKPSLNHTAAGEKLKTDAHAAGTPEPGSRPGTSTSSAFAPRTPSASYKAVATSHEEFSPSTGSYDRPASSDTYSSRSALSTRPSTAEQVTGKPTLTGVDVNRPSSNSGDRTAVLHQSIQAVTNTSLEIEELSPTGRHILQTMQKDDTSTLTALQECATLSVVPAHTASDSSTTEMAEPHVQTLPNTLLPSRSGSITISHRQTAQVPSIPQWGQVQSGQPQQGQAASDPNPPSGPQGQAASVLEVQPQSPQAGPGQARGAARALLASRVASGASAAGLAGWPAGLPAQAAGLPNRSGAHSAGPLSPSRPAYFNSRKGIMTTGTNTTVPSQERDSNPSSWSADALFRPRTVPSGSTRRQYTINDLPQQEQILVKTSGSSKHTAKTLVQPLRGVYTDLLEATQKSFAAGMGEWHLQSLDWINPAFKSQLLQGDIGPETLKAHYGLLEADVLRLYRVLYLYSFGFCAAVLEPTQRARDREQLLEAVFKAFAQLWDEALGVSFQSEMADVLRTKTDAVAAMKTMTAELSSVRSEHAELQQRLNQFVRSNIDNMLAYKQLQGRAATTQGEVTMLSSTNDLLSVKLVGAELAKEEAGLKVSSAAKRQAAAEIRDGLGRQISIRDSPPTG